MKKTSELIWQDTQHQLLFKLIDDIRAEPFDRQVLQRLQLYAEHHFALEEAYMLQLDYPEREAHIVAHDRFRDEIDQMVNTPSHMNSALRESLSVFLTEWLKRHVFGIDKRFEDFVLKSKAK